MTTPTRPIGQEARLEERIRELEAELRRRASRERQRPEPPGGGES